MKSLHYFILLIICVVGLSSCAENSTKIDLSGEWSVALDSLDAGMNEKWFSRDFPDRIHLPGTLCDAGYGTACTMQPAMEKEIFLNLKRKYDYVGVAWYKREVTIPASWSDKDIHLHLERVIWDSRVWVDDVPVNQENESLSASHLFDLSKYLSPGKHTITIRIDNRKKYDVSMPRNLAHAYTNETQVMWNGVIGEIALLAKNKLRVNEIALFPDVDHSKVQVKLDITNFTKEGTPANIRFYVKERDGRKLPVKEIKYTGGQVVFDYEMENPKLWDEFDPHIYEAVAELETETGTDWKTATFGMRKLTNKAAQLQINDRRIFLRGTLECCIFPLTGYPAMDKDGWKKVLLSAKNYGLNHIRFHSWCPPLAAFEAADEMGIYLQVELPVWILNIGQEAGTTKFLFDEADRIMSAYGNHPSFCFWSMGNELQGDFAVLDSLMMSLKERDPRHLYTTTTFTFEKGHGAWPEPNDDFWISQWTKKGWVRGQGIFDDRPVNFNKDYSAAVDSLPVPIITHEIGQYSVFPNLKEIEKYTGNLLPLNFLAVKNDLEAKGLSALADDYLMASGKLAVILYKEEIERALKTPGFSGFQLLDLHDFPGQGTALVGLLDAFWESKGLISPEEFRTFCSSVVPLVRFDKATYTNDETLTVQAELANFTNQALTSIVPAWKLTDSKGRTIAEGKLPQQDAPVGNAIPLGDFSTSLSGIQKADKLTLSLVLENTEHRNSWDIWVYPKEEATSWGEILYTRNFVEAENALAQGKTVFLNPKKEEIKGLEGKFVQVFWSPVHFPNQPGTMGILCDPKHPAFADFPTEMHSNWQWWDICKNARTMELDSLAEITPLVRMVDNFYKNRNLGLIFEAKAGMGKLLVCSSDLDTDVAARPVARQLRHSLVAYMQSGDFNPQKTISFDLVKRHIQKTDQKIEKAKSIYD